MLASDVQVADPTDRDRLRFSLTAEGGLNDGTAFPVVMLGLGLLGLHDLGAYGWRWVLVDVLWATAAGVALGGVMGACVGKLVVHLRSVHQEATGYDNFLALGCIGLAYGLALLCHAYGFLAVFAAGLALRHAEQQRAGQAPGTMTRAVLDFNEQIDRIGEVAAVVAIGMLLWALQWAHALWWMVPVLLLLARPLAVVIGLAGSGTPAGERRLIGWFGIRGVGSLFYLAYALNHGVSGELAQTLAATTVAAICASIVLHGISVTPLMALYRRRRAGSAG